MHCLSSHIALEAKLHTPPSSGKPKLTISVYGWTIASKNMIALIYKKPPLALLDKTWNKKNLQKKTYKMQNKGTCFTKWKLKSTLTVEHSVVTFEQDCLRWVENFCHAVELFLKKALHEEKPRDCQYIYLAPGGNYNIRKAFATKPIDLLHRIEKPSASLQVE